MLLAGRAAALIDRYEDGGAPAGLAEAVALAQKAVDLTGEDDPHRGMRLAVLGHALATSHQLSGDAAERDRAVTALSTADRLLPGGHPMRVLVGDDLATALVERYETGGEPADLDRAAGLAHEILAARPRGHPDRAAALSRLDLIHLARYEMTGDRRALDEAVRHADLAVESAVDPHDQVMYRSNRANRLLSRFDATGRIEDLDQGVETLADALARLPDDHADKVTVWLNHGNALLTRHRFTGDLTDLSAAIASYRHVVNAPGRPPVDRARDLSNLGSALVGWYESTEDPASLDEAVGVDEDALRLLAPGHPDRPTILANLGAALRLRHDRNGVPADLERAIGVCREAVRGTPAGHPGMVDKWTSLAGALLAWFEHTEDREALDAGLEAAHAALGAAPDESPARATGLANLARGYDLRFSVTEDPADRERAAELGLAAASEVAAPFPVRMEAALQNGRRAMRTGDWGAAADHFAMLVSFFPMVALRLGPRGGWEHLLGEWGGAPFTAAAAAVNAGRPVDAVTVLEQGRGVLWAQALDRRAGPGASAGRRPPSAAPVVLLNVSPLRCDALVAGADGVTVIPLATLTQKLLLERFLAYVDALEGAEVEPAERERAITDILEWLWDHVAEPVLTGLGHTAAPPDGRWPHVTWCPTGALALMPIHAAGYHRPEHAAAGRTVLDRVISSYTATLRAAVQADEPSGGGDGRLLFVGMPETPGAEPLRGVRDEGDAVRKLLGPACTVLEGPAATRRSVGEELTRHTMAHFSCHGRQDLDDPAAGGVLLHDGVLSVADLTGAQRGEFAFLSACDTAVGSPTLMDEMVTLAAALQYAGWRHVVATLWRVRDRVAAEVTRSVYDRLVVDGRLRPDGAAEALHHAVRAVRDRRLRAGRHFPSEWTPFIHVGT